MNEETAETTVPEHPHFSTSPSGQPMIDKIAPQIVAAQKQIDHARKNSQNPHFNSDYADLPSVIDAGKPALNEHGIALLQMPEGDTLTTYLIHTSGQFIRFTDAIKAEKAGSHARVSAITYARRVAMASALCMGQADDDGNAAQPARQIERKPKPARKTKPAQTQRPADLIGEDPIVAFGVAQIGPGPARDRLLLLTRQIETCEKARDGEKIKIEAFSLITACQENGIDLYLKDEISGWETALENARDRRKKRLDARRNARAAVDAGATS